MDGIGFFTLDSTFFWLVVIFSSFDSVFVYIGLLVLLMQIWEIFYNIVLVMANY